MQFPQIKTKCMLVQESECVHETETDEDREKC